MSNLVFQASSGGSITLTGANTASTATITIPATTGNMVTTGDSGTVTVTMISATGTPSSTTFLRGDGTWASSAQVYPGAGIANSTGSAWGTSYTTSGSGTVVALATGATLSSPVISTIVNTGTLTLPTSTDTLVGRATTDTLTNKTLTSPTLTTPLLGTPTSGNLSNCTADGTNSVGYLNIPINSQSAAYTLVLADAGKSIFHPSTDANARTFTIPANSSVAYALGTAITFINMTSQVVSIAITTDTMYLAGTGTTGTRSLAQYGVATAIKMTSTTWIISGNGLT